jgi:hypothetical protein
MARPRKWNGWTWDGETGSWYVQVGTARVMMTCAPDDRPLEPARLFSVAIPGNAPGGPLAAGELEVLVPRLYAYARQSVDQMWGTPSPRVGPVFYRALIGAELLRLCAWQDLDVADATVRGLAEAFWEMLRDDADVNRS